MIKIESLAAIPFFADFSAEELNGVATMMTERVYRPGEIIFLEGQAADGLFFGLRGDGRGTTSFCRTLSCVSSPGA